MPKQAAKRRPVPSAREGRAPAKPAAARASFSVGTELASDYIVLHRDGLPEPKGPAEPIGSGGASVVFRCEYRDLPHRAVKVLAPSQELLQRVSWERFEDTFTREIRMLTRITHTRIAKILDYGVYEADGERH